MPMVPNSSDLPRELLDTILGRIDREEVAELTLTLANIDSPPTQEGPMAQFVFDWMEQNGFRPRKIGLFEDRFNVLGIYPGSEDGYSLCFNSHMDTGIGYEDGWSYRRPDHPVFHSAWREGDIIRGYGAVNDKGPMAAWMLAAKAIKDSGTPLKGDLLLTTVCGETGREPVDEFRAPQHVAKEAGARYLITHGAVSDFALVAEATGFDVAWIEAGKAFFKLTVYGEKPVYTPFLRRPTSLDESPNAVVRMSQFISTLEEWAYEYETRNRLETEGGIVVPKVNIGAIRGGSPTVMVKTVEVCSLYLDVRLNPEQNPLVVRSELRQLLTGAGLNGEVEIFLYRRGYKAKDIEPLTGSVARSHRHVFGRDVKLAAPPVSSMWRDTNPFNEMGIPALTYGPAAGAGGGDFSITVDSLYDAARVYAAVALDICSQAGPRRGSDAVARSK